MRSVIAGDSRELTLLNLLVPTYLNVVAKL